MAVHILTIFLFISHFGEILKSPPTNYLYIQCKPSILNPTCGSLIKLHVYSSQNSFGLRSTCNHCWLESAEMQVCPENNSDIVVPFLIHVIKQLDIGNFLMALIFPETTRLLPCVFVNLQFIVKVIWAIPTSWWL